MNSSARAIGFSALPSVTMLVLYYSLAAHMYVTLGGWPSDIGERDFPLHLLAHVYLAVYYCIISAVCAVVLLPFVAVVCAFIERWRATIPYLVFCSILLLCCFWFTQYGAPTGFLYWWRD